MCISEIHSICENDFSCFISKKNVVGIGHGTKVTNGIDTGIDCLTVFVSQKTDFNNLSFFDSVPSEYKGIKTDVVEIGEIYATGLTQKVRPVVFGYSIGPSDLNLAGTSGYVVTDGTDSYILSNNHVLAGENLLPLGTSIVQPSILDRGSPLTDVVAKLSKFTPIQFSTATSSPTNYVDCAIAKVTSLNLISNRIFNIGVISGINTKPRLNTKVEKSGRTTGYTTGIIKALNSTVLVNYSGGKSAIFKNQIVTSVMSSPGDSGSLLVDSKKLAIGLLFAGSTTATIYNPINTVLISLGVHLP